MPAHVSAPGMGGARSLFPVGKTSTTRPSGYSLKVATLSVIALAGIALAGIALAGIALAGIALAGHGKTVFSASMRE